MPALNLDLTRCHFMDKQIFITLKKKQLSSVFDTVI